MRCDAWECLKDNGFKQHCSVPEGYRFTPCWWFSAFQIYLVISMRLEKDSQEVDHCVSVTEVSRLATRSSKSKFTAEVNGRAEIKRQCVSLTRRIMWSMLVPWWAGGGCISFYSFHTQAVLHFLNFNFIWLIRSEVWFLGFSPHSYNILPCEDPCIFSLTSRIMKGEEPVKSLI